MTLLQSLVPSLGRAVRVPGAQNASSSEPRVKPVYHLREDENGFEAIVQLPGVAKEGLEITSEEGQIRIFGRRAWNPPSAWTTLYRETSRAPFELTLAHGAEIDATKISAELKNGLLHVTLPKAEAAKPRKISVS